MARQDLALVFVCAAVYSSTALYATNILSFKSRQHVSPRNEVLDCTAELSKDLYGLGVRLGIYFQWFSGWVSNNFVAEEVAGGLDANSIFLFAVFVSMVSSTKSDELAQIDAFIMLMLGAGTVWGVLSIWGYRTCLYRDEGPDAIKHFGGFGTHLRLLLSAAIAWYLIWFWTLGIQGLPNGIEPFGKTHPEACKEVTVFTLPIRGPVRYVALGLGIATTVYNVLLTAAAPLAAVTRVRKIIMLWRTGQFSTSTKLRYATAATPKQLHKMSCWFGGINLVWMIFIMLLVEITLNENNMQDVLGARSSLGNGGLTQPGQLLPMLIGAFSFTRILFITFEYTRNPDHDITPSLGRDGSRPFLAPPGSIKGWNIFKAFSPGNVEPRKRRSMTRSEDDLGAPEYEAFVKKLETMSAWRKIMITWLPWLSLLHFSPWTKHESTLVSQKDDQSDQVPLTTNPRGRYSEWDDDGKAGIGISYRSVSRNSAEEGSAQQTQQIV